MLLGGPIRFVSMLVFAGLAGVGIGQAQTEKAVREQHGLMPHMPSLVQLQLLKVSKEVYP